MTTLIAVYAYGNMNIVSGTDQGISFIRMG